MAEAPLLPEMKGDALRGIECDVAFEANLTGSPRHLRRKVLGSSLSSLRVKIRLKTAAWLSAARRDVGIFPTWSSYKVIARMLSTESCLNGIAAGGRSRYGEDVFRRPDASHGA
jgi:hypothetical protein